MKKQIDSICESQVIVRGRSTYKEFRKSAKEFFKTFVISPEDETFYVVKAHIDESGYVSCYGVFYGEDQRLDLVVESSADNDEVFLAEAYSQEAMLEFIKMRKKRSVKENMYIFKVSFENYELSHVQSFYGGEHDLVLKMYPHQDLVEVRPTEAIKTLGTLTEEM